MNTQESQKAEAKEAELGRTIANALGMKKRNGHARWITTWGDKTDMGLALSVRRMIAEHDGAAPVAVPLHERVQTIGTNLGISAWNNEQVTIGGGVFGRKDLDDAGTALKALPVLVKEFEALLARCSEYMVQDAGQSGLTNREAIARAHATLEMFKS